MKKKCFITISVKIMTFGLELKLLKRMSFQCLCGFNCDFLEFPLVKSSKICALHPIWLDKNYT